MKDIVEMRRYEGTGVTWSRERARRRLGAMLGRRRVSAARPGLRGGAAWALFRWSSPTRPDGWHSVTVVANDLGTRVYVHHDRQSLGESGGASLVPGH